MQRPPSTRTRTLTPSTTLTSAQVPSSRSPGKLISESTPHGIRPSLVHISTHDATILSREKRSMSEGVNNPQQLKKKRNHNGAKMRSWKRLPPNILFRIFHFAQEEDQSALAQVMAVSKLWKKAALAYPTLWAQPIIENEGDKAELKARTFLRRSRHSLLTVRYKQEPGLSPFLRWPAWEILKVSANRWENLSLQYLNDTEAAIQIASLPAMEKLKHLSVTVNTISTRENDGNLGLDCIDTISFPSLTSLSLNVFKLPEATLIPWLFQLSTIHIVDQYDDIRGTGKPISAKDLLHFIAASPWVQDFCFEGGKFLSSRARNASVHEPEFISSAPLPLPRMCRIMFTSPIALLSTFFRNVFLPNLTHLELHPRLANVSRGYPGFYERIRDTIMIARELRSLRIEGFDPQVFLYHGKRGLQWLTCLHLESVSNFESMIDALSSPQTDRNNDIYWILPRLEELKIQSLTHSFPFDKFSDMIEKRHTASQRQPIPLAIREFVVGNQRLLTGLSKNRKITPYQQMKWHPNDYRMEKRQRRNTSVQDSGSFANPPT